MGGSISKRGSSRRSSSRSSSHSWNYTRSPYAYANQTQGHVPQEYGHSSQSNGSYGGGAGNAHEPKKRLERKYSKIDDDYNSLEQVNIFTTYCIIAEQFTYSQSVL